VTVLGIVEAYDLQGRVSWISPITRPLLKAYVSDELKLLTLYSVLDLEMLPVGRGQGRALRGLTPAG